MNRARNVAIESRKAAGPQVLLAAAIVFVPTGTGCRSPSGDATDPLSAHHRMLNNSYDQRFGRQYDGVKRVDPHGPSGSGFFQSRDRRW